jgi:hypothetical protein
MKTMKIKKTIKNLIKNNFLLIKKKHFLNTPKEESFFSWMSSKHLKKFSKNLQIPKKIPPCSETQEYYPSSSPSIKPLSDTESYSINKNLLMNSLNKALPIFTSNITSINFSSNTISKKNLSLSQKSSPLTSNNNFLNQKHSFKIWPPQLKAMKTNPKVNQSKLRKFLKE